MKIFYIYAKIPRLLFDERLKYLLSTQHTFHCKKGYMCGLYAFTNSKKIMKKFLEFRDPEVYSVIKDDIDDDEYQNIHLNKSDLELRYSDFTLNEKEKIEMVVTKNEETIIKFDGKEYINAYGPSSYVKTNFYIFNDKIINALDGLGYTKSYIDQFGSDDEVDYMYYNESFGLSPLMNDHMNSKYNELNLLLYLYRYFFIGSDIKGDGYNA